MAGQSDLYHPRICNESPGPLVSEVDFDPEEAAALSTVVGKQTKYGSTSSHTFTNQKFITHFVMPGDTLQGIYHPRPSTHLSDFTLFFLGLALKYSVTVSTSKSSTCFGADT